MIVTSIFHSGIIFPKLIVTMITMMKQLQRFSNCTTILFMLNFVDPFWWGTNVSSFVLFGMDIKVFVLHSLLHGNDKWMLELQGILVADAAYTVIRVFPFFKYEIHYFYYTKQCTSSLVNNKPGMLEFHNLGIWSIKQLINRSTCVWTFIK